MSLSLKLDLENRIFARAAVLRVRLYTRKRRLIATPNSDEYLQALLRVYNRFFPLPADEELSWQRNDLQQRYLSQRPFMGGIKNGWILPAPSGKRKMLDK